MYSLENLNRIINDILGVSESINLYELENFLKSSVISYEDDLIREVYMYLKSINCKELLGIDYINDCLVLYRKFEEMKNPLPITHLASVWYDFSDLYASSWLGVSDEITDVLYQRLYDISEKILGYNKVKDEDFVRTLQVFRREDKLTFKVVDDKINVYLNGKLIDE